MQIEFEELNLDLGESSLNVVASRPAMGKTSFLIQLAEIFSLQGNKIIFLTLEQDAKRLKKRFLGNADCVEFFDSKQLNYYESANWIDEILENCNSYPEGTIFFVDSVQQLCKPYGNRLKYELIEYFMSCAKFVSVTHNWHFFISSALSRKVEERQGHRPSLCDLTSSASLEEIPDNVMFIYRRDYYDPMDKPGFAEIILAKSRNNPVQSYSFYFDKDKRKFLKYVPIDYRSNFLDEKSETAFQEFSPV